MGLNRGDREVFATGSLAFAFLALVLAFGALITAAQALSHSNRANKRIAAFQQSGPTASATEVREQEFSISDVPSVVKAGKVTLTVGNHGTITHELVLVRAANADALPRVTKPGGERSVGAVDEEAIPEADKMGEAGDVPAGGTVKKAFDLPVGTYVMFCNIDQKNGDTVLNHFKSGMHATLVVG